MTRITADTSSVTAGDTPYAELIRLTRDANLMAATMALLAWDQETMMPSRGLDFRSRQLAQLARTQHRMSTDPRIGEALAACEDDADLLADPLAAEAVNVREIRRSYDRLTKLPVALVEELAQTTSLAQHEWAEARRESDFARFRPWLEKIVGLVRRQAECYGWPEDGEPWDALAEDYEPGCTAADVEQVFTPLRRRLSALLDDILGGPVRPSPRFNRTRLPVEQQGRFARMVAEQIGFDFSRGRLDRSTHPFCSGTHCHDVRLTTRFRDDNVNDALGSTMHESGHGIYEQGLLGEHIGTPMGRAVSLGIHESQSRMWENQVGRSRPFWVWCHPQLGKHFGSAVGGLSLDEVYGAANIVEPDFIRVEADEATYDLHIMVRFKLERAIMSGDLAVADLPGAWNEAYRDHLGLDVPDDRRGCLQDIHWSSGSFGYFPTYTLGNLYAAQLFEQALADIPDLHAQFEKGKFGALKTWLNTGVHAHGMRYGAADRCEHVTGKSLSADPLMRHLDGKLRPLYGV